jgi:hypothetical protein
MLDGKCYVAGSMVSLAVFQIKKSYFDGIDCEHTNDAVSRLTRILLKDFDNRYIPSEGGRVKYFRDDEIGVHQYVSSPPSWIPELYPFKYHDWEGLSTGQDRHHQPKNPLIKNPNSKTSIPGVVFSAGRTNASKSMYIWLFLHITFYR